MNDFFVAFIFHKACFTVDFFISIAFASFLSWFLTWSWFRQFFYSCDGYMPVSTALEAYGVAKLLHYSLALRSILMRFCLILFFQVFWKTVSSIKRYMFFKIFYKLFLLLGLRVGSFEEHMRKLQHMACVIWFDPGLFYLHIWTNNLLHCTQTCIHERSRLCRLPTLYLFVNVSSCFVVKCSVGLSVSCLHLNVLKMLFQKRLCM